MNRTGEKKNSYGGQKIGRSLILLLSLIMSSCMLFGCGASGDASGTGKFYLYYLNKDFSTINPMDYSEEAVRAAGVSDAALISDVLGTLSEAAGNVDYQPPVSNFDILSWSLNEDVMTIDVSKDYLKLGEIRQILVRAALINTLCQVDGVSLVTFTVEGSALTDSQGNEIKAQSSEMFISNSGKELNDYRKVNIHLYFADKKGTALIDTYRTVVYNSNISMERLVVEEVLKGPNSDVVYPTLSKDTRIISVTTRDGVCYVNLDNKFLNDPYKVTPEVAVYSLVNSLTELSSVRKVQITIDGDAGASFMEISLQTPFERNLSVVDKNESKDE